MKIIKMLGNVIFWLTLISPLASFALASTVGESDIFGVLGIVRYSWIMWLFIPIGILSILIGLKLKKCKQNYKNNFIVAFICLPIIILFGSYSFIFNDISYDTERLTVIENKINLELPDAVKIATNEIDSYNVSYVKITGEPDKEKFEREIEQNNLWEKLLSTKIKSILPFDIQAELSAFDCFLFYNATNGDYNIYPPDGEYE